MSDYTTLAELIKNSIERFGERPYLGTKIAGTYRWLTYAEFDIKMRKLRAALHRFGLKKGDVVAIIANNSVPFALTMYASYGLGAVMVPMYEVQRPQDWDFILRNSNARFLFVTNDTIRTQIEALHIENLEKIITIRSEDPQSPHSFDRIIEEETGFMDHIALDPDSDADILYTSGTAGQPKGVVLSHANIVENVKRVLSCFSISETDRTLAFLPWAHAFGKTTELHAFPSLGASVALVESNRTIAQNLLEINPTVLVAVPKIFNKIYDTVHQRAQNKPIAKTLLAHSEYIAQKARRNQELSAFNKLQRVVLDRLVGKKIRAAFGNALRFCISGGAALSEEVAFFFDDFGVVICEGYGLSESGPIVAVNTPDDRRIGAAGKPLPGVPVRIEPLADQTDSQQGEIIVGGPCIMKRYHLAPEETANALTDNHELRTGDMGFIDSDGNLWVTGRVKEQYKLENGKYVVP
ncbi:MAG: AMP-binding protein, partial [Proteobacteria bacterium]|nr:AMP-binding protein [Pseudomonadota bacterium]